MSFFSGLSTVVGLELRQRVRSKRWFIALTAWFVFIGFISGLIIWTARFSYTQLQTEGYSTVLDINAQTGPMVFGTITLFVLGMGLLIAPTFSATSINGDRAQGTLATLQATRLSAAQIASGKLVAAWLTSLTFLVAALPFIIVAVVLGNISAWQVIVCFAVVFVEVAVVCAIGLGWSALISRTAGSVVMTYMCVVGLTIISLILVACLVPLNMEQGKVRVYGIDTWEYYDDTEPKVTDCTWYESEETFYHADRFWWLTAVNPFVIVSDSAPLPDAARDNLTGYVSSTGDPLATIHLAVRAMAEPMATERDDCYWVLQYYESYHDAEGNLVLLDQNGRRMDYESPVKVMPVGAGPPVWPWGMASNVLLGAAFFAVACRRLKVPYRTLPKGIRVA
ncbi:MAG: ABC transporter permease [Propionibacteriaceae bacterium]|jgi:ABC-type transport system involved in multi-copper enzyme maturation permease subunit|nr:ABC transporter permease [Propionibacteriaceae bacterium]